MSLYNQDAHHTITFEIIMNASSDSLNGNLAYIYHQVSPELIATLRNIEAIGKPAVAIGINGGDDTNYVQMERFDGMMYSFNLAVPRP